MPVIDTIDSGGAASAAPGRATAGSRLKAAREAAGLSLDAVAQQLKLAPRQVRALEEDDWARLPGRTFVRGFARNYARFVQLDPEAVLALLPSPDTVPALERPTLAGTGRPMGEIPVERVTKPSAARWLLPLLLLVLLAAAAFYEFDFARPNWRLPDFLSRDGAQRTAQPEPAQAVAPATIEGSGTLTTALPNPVAGAAPATPPAGDTRDAAGGAAQPGAATEPLPMTSAASPAGAPAMAAAAPQSAAATQSAATTPAQSAGAPSDATPAEAALVLTFKGTSWAEVKDARGRVVLQMTGGPGMTQTVSALPPLELALGNAPLVDVTYRGQALDLAPYMRGNVARVALR